VEAISEQLIPHQGKITLQKPFIPNYLQPKDRTFHHSYSIWSQYNAPKGRAWRVEQFLGLDQRSERLQTETIEVEDGKITIADIVILDDANLGFRDGPANWPQAILEENKPLWILVKMSKPVAQGALWDYLLQNHADRLIPVIPVNDLRFTEVHISKGLSWERTAQDLAWELVHNPCVNSLSHCPFVIISFGTAGAILLEHSKNGNSQGIPEFKLFFDPQVIEGMWGQDYSGKMIGYTTCLTASIAHQLMLFPDKPNIAQGIQSGLSAMQNLFLVGYDFGGEKDCELTFPTSRILETLKKENPSFASVTVENPVYDYEKSVDVNEGSVPQGWWTILEDRYQDNLAHVAEQVVKRGLDGKIELLLGDSENIPFPDDVFDVAMVAFGVRNFSNPSKGLMEMRRVIKNEGMIIVLEFSKPSRFPFRAVYNFYFRNILPFFGKLFSKDKTAYSYLPESVMNFPDNEEFLDLLSMSGFSRTKQTKLTGGVASIYTGVKLATQ